jgi:multidrug transporter EmrE-like cation transporter
LAPPTSCGWDRSGRVTLAGILLYQEGAQPLRLGFVALIVAGVIGLRLLEP